jgi:hypothetical protein
MLVRRVRQRLNAELICIGTSATMATEGTAAERNAIVASVSSKLFGADVPPEHIVTETLERVTEGAIPSAQELGEALQANLSEDITGAWDAGLLKRHPLARWVELELGLEQEDGKPDGKWVRSSPQTLNTAAEKLVAASNIDATIALKQLTRFLLAAYKVEVAPNRRFFAFRLHQFVSAGGDVHSSLEAPHKRYLTLKGPPASGKLSTRFDPSTRGLTDDHENDL